MKKNLLLNNYIEWLNDTDKIVIIILNKKICACQLLFCQSIAIDFSTLGDIFFRQFFSTFFYWGKLSGFFRGFFFSDEWSFFLINESHWWEVWVWVMIVAEPGKFENLNKKLRMISGIETQACLQFNKCWEFWNYFWRLLW